MKPTLPRSHVLQEATATLWRHLRFKQVQGVRFVRRQALRSGFEADFYAPEVRLAIVLRTELRMNAYQAHANEPDALPVMVLAFECWQVFCELDAVLNVIAQLTKERKQAELPASTVF